ncbi:OmpA family protein [Vibrio ostreicida]|uniref:OmpA family protein n=1 Tax=Vibrio ostreicida TaxID=526588 RepID=A0ABT8BR97_9VIBR|nr:OmpA family protein [Vibrio ostreicida]MDN3609468.1 OmpA family protein [Vibrio ostreicida]NPD08349.1 OmpA family protein [Vibrio ostreicida]
MDEAAWTHNGGRLKCSLIIDNSSYGKFYFRSEEVAKIYFFAEVKNFNKKWTGAELLSLSAPWNTNNPPQLITDGAQIKNSTLSFVDNITTLMGKIESGDWITIRLNGNQPSDVRAYILPTTRIKNQLQAFRQCQTALPSMSFTDARDITLSFDIGQVQLTTAQSRVLKDLHSYLNADSSIDKVLIDGYTDNIGSSISNLSVSRQRAEHVAETLRKLGVKKALLELRAHGSRYPLASNETQQGQSKNRRVTLRLVRSNETTTRTDSPQINDKKKA